MRTKKYFQLKPLFRRLYKFSELTKVIVRLRTSLPANFIKLVRKFLCFGIPLVCTVSRICGITFGGSFPPSQRIIPLRTDSSRSSFAWLPSRNVWLHVTRQPTRTLCKTILHLSSQHKQQAPHRHFSVDFPHTQLVKPAPEGAVPIRRTDSCRKFLALIVSGM